MIVEYGALENMLEGNSESAQGTPPLSRSCSTHRHFRVEARVSSHHPSVVLTESAECAPRGGCPNGPRTEGPEEQKRGEQVCELIERAARNHRVAREPGAPVGTYQEDGRERGGRP
jgi:hypothetical protein